MASSTRRQGINFGSATWRMWVAGTAVATMSAAVNMASPLYPVLARQLQMPDAMMTALYATFAVTAVFSLLLFGSLADVIGRQPALTIGLVLTLAGTALFAIEGSIVVLFAGRVLLGIGLGLGTGAAIAIMVESSPGISPARGSTWATIAFVAGSAAGPMMTGILAQYSSDTTVPFFMMLAVICLVIALVLTMYGGRRPGKARWRPVRPAVPAEMRRTFAVAAMTGFVAWSIVGVFLALLPSMAEAATTTPNYAIAGTVTGAVLLCSALSQLVVTRLEPRAAQTIGLTALALGMTLLVCSYLPLFMNGPAVVVMAIAAVICGIGHGLSYWGAAREVDVATPRHCRASVSAALYLSFYTGAGVPALAVGTLSLSMPLLTAILVVALVLVLLTVTFLPVPGLVEDRIINRRPVAGVESSYAHLNVPQTHSP